MSVDKVDCKLIGQCSGCAWLDQEYDSQLDLKKNEIVKQLGEIQFPQAHIQFVHNGPRAERTRLDLTLETVDGAPKLGLYATGGSGITDMPTCPMATVELDSWLKEFRKLPLPQIRKGSLRLRISPQGKKGIWLDFANEDVKKILDESSWLTELSKLAIVEIGQRNKRLIHKEGRHKLGDAEPFPWFQTYLGRDLKPHPLYMSIAGFTQTGFASNRLLIKTAMDLLEKIKTQDVLELFCGSGNFTLAMASRGIKVKAIELDEGALSGLKKSAEEAELLDQIQIQRKDLYRASSEDLKAPVWFVDPPRSGLRSVLDRLNELEGATQPQHLLYVSCFPQSFGEDAKKLKTMGYELKHLTGVDQFPNTPHCEWVSLFSKL